MAKSSKGRTDSDSNADAATPAAPAEATQGETKQGAQGAQAAQGVSVKWDDAQMRTSYANVCNVFGTREEITLLFGTNQVWQPGELQGGQVRVALGERVVLTPYTAKRLALMLEKGLAEYEKRFGKIEL